MYYPIGVRLGLPIVSARSLQTKAFGSHEPTLFRADPIESTEHGVRVEDYGSALVYYGKKTFSSYGTDSPYADYIGFKTPMRLDEALKTLLQLKTEGSTFTLPYEPDSLRVFAAAAADSRLQNKVVKNVIGVGAVGLAFELENGRVLKLSSRNHFGGRSHEPTVDLPVYDHIQVMAEVPDRRGRIGRYPVYAYEQAMGDTTNLTVADVEKVLMKIHRAGLHPQDIDKHRLDQIARFANEPYLVDPECASKNP